MTDFANAALKLPVALSSFGVQRLLGALPMGDSESIRKARANLYKAGNSARKEFSANPLLFGAFQDGMPLPGLAIRYGRAKVSVIHAWQAALRIHIP